MKNLLIALSLSLVCGFAAAAEGGKSAGGMKTDAAAAKSAPVIVQGASARANRGVDARECLKQETNKAIHACAEKYR